MTYVAVDHFRGRTPSWPENLGDSVLRAAGDSPIDATDQWPAPVRSNRAVSASRRAASATGGVFAERNPDVIFGFQEGTRADVRWRGLADRKLAELNALAEQIMSMQKLLRKMKAACHCKTLETCGKAIFTKGVSTVPRQPLPLLSNAGE
jgi:hypothetical protein